MSAAQLEISEQVEAPGPALLKQQVAERLAHHRMRRGHAAREAAAASAQGNLLPDLEVAGSPRGGRSRGIAEAVAERYARTQSYRAFLAEEAEKAIRQAEAAAEIAARSAQAIAATQQRLLDELAEFDRAEAAGPELVSQTDGPAVEAVTAAASGLTPIVTEREEVRPRARSSEEARTTQPTQARTAQTSSAGLTVRLYEDVGRGTFQGGSRVEQAPAGMDPEERMALDEEIAFRASPTFELDQPSVPIPGNLLEFPRQLVATRRARPRYAEGPLRDEVEGGLDHSQLRIFEVEPDQMSSAPVLESSAPEWSSIWLDALAKDTPDVVEESQFSAALRPQTATLDRRAMAAIVDGCLIALGLVAFATLFAWNVAELPSLPVAAMAGGVALAVLYLTYQMLFFSLSEATPGMRFARIGLCTFGDENPTRSAMRRRTFAVLLAACPLGLGLLWACLDEDGLGWHDRISRMYQRSY
jgi:uncharacterized RDD family membrane protein YckC